MKHILKPFLFLIYFIFASLLVIPLSSAVGVTTPYWDTHPLILAPGQTEDVNLLLQNMVGGETVAMRAALVAGADIATLTDEHPEYTIPFGTKDMLVPIHITIPKKAEEKYIITVSFTTIDNTQNQDMIRMATAIKTHIPIIIREPPSPETPEPQNELQNQNIPKKPSSQPYVSFFSTIHIPREILFSSALLIIIIIIWLIKRNHKQRHRDIKEYILQRPPRSKFSRF